MSQVTSKGQVTIPKPIREKLGLRPGDTVEFIEEKGVVRVVKKRDPAAIKAAIEKWKGFLNDPGDSDALVAEMRGPRLDEQ